MANGEARRWGNYLGKPKHLVEITEGESLLARTVRLVHAQDPHAEVIISAHDERYAVEGAQLYTPPVRDLEIDRFVPELLDRPCCYLYGDAYYTEESIRTICRTSTSHDMLFFGNAGRIFAVKMLNPGYVCQLLDELRRNIVAGKIDDCKGWQLYHRYLGMELAGKDIADDFVFIEDATTDFNTPDEYLSFIRNRK